MEFLRTAYRIVLNPARDPEFIGMDCLCTSTGTGTLEKEVVGTAFLLGDCLSATAEIFLKKDRLQVLRIAV